MAQGATLGAPPIPVRCTATPVAVIGRGGREGGVLGGTATPRAVPTWNRPRTASEGWSPDTMVYTAMCTIVHHRVLSGATACFQQRLGEPVEGTAPVGGALP